MIRYSVPNRSLVTCLAVFLWCTPAFAVDAITLKSSAKRLSGSITSVSKTKVVIKTGLRKNKPVDVPVNDIVKIEWDKGPGTLNGLLNAEANGRLKDAVDGYDKLLKDPKITNEYVKTDLRFFIARVNAKMALAQTAKLPAAITGLQNFRKTHANSYHYYRLLALLGDLQITAKSYEDARTTFSLMSKVEWKDVKLAANCGEARVLVAQKKPQQALKIYESVLAQTGADPTLNSLKNQAGLGTAACLQLTDKNTEALKILSGVIDRAASTNSELLAEAYVLKGDSYRVLGRSKESLLAYLHVDVLFAREVKYHPKALYYLALLWAETGKPIRAGSAKARLKADYPGSDWAKK